MTKTSLGADYNPTDRWARGASDKVLWIGIEGVAPLSKALTARGDINWQKFNGDWTTANLAAPDANSAVAYPFPSLSQPYMQGIFKETRSSAADIGDMNASRFLFLDARYTKYTAHVVSAFVHVKF